MKISKQNLREIIVCIEKETIIWINLQKFQIEIGIAQKDSVDLPQNKWKLIFKKIPETEAHAAQCVRKIAREVDNSHRRSPPQGVSL